MEIALFAILQSLKNEWTSKIHNFWSRQDFASGESPGIFSHNQISNFWISQHLLTFGQHLSYIGHAPCEKHVFLRGSGHFHFNKFLLWPLHRFYELKQIEYDVKKHAIMFGGRILMIWLLEVNINNLVVLQKSSKKAIF